MTISVALTTYNEEKKIYRCLKSVESWVDEIVIVDGSSTDRTVEIANKFKAKVIHSVNHFNFHLNKKKAISHCRGDWILQLDADEVVTYQLRKEIIRVIKEKDNNCTNELINGYWIPRKNFFLGKWLKKGGQFPDYTLRLYRRGKGVLPGKNVHEQAKVVGKTGYLNNPLLHYSYSNFSEYLEHFDRYTDFFAWEFKRNKVNLSVFSFFLYFFVKPLFWFISTYLRHKGYQDGFPGFVFSLFSSVRFPVVYIKVWEKNHKNKNWLR